MKLDVDGNGRLSISELKNGLNINAGSNSDQFDVENVYQYHDVLEKCDMDNDGTLDFNEFIQAAVCQKALVNKQNLKKMFRIFDVENDQKISIENLRSVFSDKVSSQKCQAIIEIMKEFDTEGTSQISFDQF